MYIIELIFSWYALEITELVQKYVRRFLISDMYQFTRFLTSELLSIFFQGHNI